MIFRQVKG